MKIAIVTESFLPSLNGVTTSVLRVIDTLKANGDEVLVIAPTSPEPAFQECPVVTVPNVPLGGFPVAIPTATVSSSLDRFAPDLIHVAAPFWLGGQSIAYAAKRGIPTVAVFQTHVAGYMQRYGLDFAEPLIDAITEAIHRPATVNLAPTEDGKNYLAGLGISHVELWGRGVDSSLFTPERKQTSQVVSFRAELAQGAKHLVGYVGRLAPEKQVGRLIELCDLPDTRIVIVGDGPDRIQLRNRFARHSVTFTGKLIGDDLANAYAAMDVFVHCGTEETYGQTIQEAHASGLPVVAPSVGGQRHLISSGLNGFLVDHSQWGSYRLAVETLLNNPDRLETMAREARRSVEHNTWEANNQKLLEVYRRVVQQTAALSALAA